MRAVRVHDFDLSSRMQVDEVPKPDPKVGELLIKSQAVGINPVDIAIRAANHPYAKLVSPPYIPGAEASGEIVSVGNGVSGFTIGERVYGRAIDGAYSEFVRLDAKASAILPSSCSFEQGASMTVAFYTAWNALVIKAQVRPGEIILIQGGAGGVGSAAIQLAKRLGCVVITTVSSEEKSDFCKSIGADYTINYKKEDFVEKSLELTNGKGVNTIIELCACDNFDRDIDAVCVDGQIIVIGTGTGKGPETQFRVPAVMTKDVHIHGLAVINLFPKMPELIRRFSVLLGEGSLNMNIDKIFKFDKANEAHEYILEGKFLGKVILVP
ncbi:MAG: zinc-binding alcohol dehydrogenase family protein [bacterium]